MILKYIGKTLVNTGEKLNIAGTQLPVKCAGK